MKFISEQQFNDNIEQLIKDGCVIPNMTELTHFLEKGIVDFTIDPHSGENFIRLSEHFRSILVSTSGWSWLTIKGLEPHLKDCDPFLRDLTSPHAAVQHSTATHFVAKEGKIPLGVTNDEADIEIAATNALVLDYMLFHGFLPAVPIPVFRFIFETPESYVKQLKRLFPSLRVPDSMSVIVYLTKSHPARVKHALLLQGNAAEDARVRIDSENFIDTLTTNFARIFEVGYIPGAAGYEHLGFPTKSQNVGIDGGLFDTGSLLHVSQLGELESLSTNLYCTISYLAETVGLYLLHDKTISRQEAVVLFFGPIVRELVGKMDSDQFEIRRCLLNFISSPSVLADAIRREHKTDYSNHEELIVI